MKFPRIGVGETSEKVMPRWKTVQMEQKANRTAVGEAVAWPCQLRSLELHGLEKGGRALECFLSADRPERV